MNALLNLLIDLFAGAVNVASIRWPETATRHVIGESESERRSKRILAVTFLSALIVIPLVIMGWLSS